MCYKPIRLKRNDMYVPCGKCPKCISRKICGWAFRLQQEYKQHLHAKFITLTYDNSNLPTDLFGRGELRKRDLQLFFKRYRKALHSKSVQKKGKARVETPTVRYYAVGEYGGKTRRPHYHLIGFGFIPELVMQTWNQGFCHFGDVTPSSIGYTLKYMSKNQKRWKQSKHGIALQPEFALMSKGLGLNYLTPQMVNFHAKDLEHSYITFPGGAKSALPRYYRDRLFYEEEKAAIAAANEILAHEKGLKRIELMTAKSFKEEMAAIDAAYDRMWNKSIKSKI